LDADHTLSGARRVRAARARAWHRRQQSARAVGQWPPCPRTRARGRCDRRDGGMMNRVIPRAAAAVALLSALAPLSAIAQSARDVPVVTLDEARRRAELVNPGAVAARSRVETGVWERRSALTDLFTPHVDAGVSYTRFSDPFFNFGTGNISRSEEHTSEIQSRE